MCTELLRLMHLQLKHGQTIHFSDLNLAAFSGEIHGVAGLSFEQRWCLLSYFTGACTASCGNVYLSGHACSPDSGEPFQSEVFCIGPSTSLVEHMTITENLYILQPHARGPGWINRQSFSEECEQLFETFGFQADPDSLVRDLSSFGRMGIELLKAVVLHAKIIVYNRSLDDLSAFEFTQFCSLVESIASFGITVMILCCAPDRMLQICRRITVVKNGRTMKSFLSSEISGADITHILSGSYPENPEPKDPAGSQAVLLNLHNLRLQEDNCPVSLTVRSGEIIGFVDDISSNSSQILDAIAGFIPCDRDALSACGTMVPANQVSAAFQAGIFMVKHIGSTDTLLPDTTVRVNIMLPLLKHSSKFAGVIRKKFLFLESVQAAEAVGIPSVQLDQPLHSELTLRVQLARIWLSKRPVLLLDNAFAGLSEDDRLFLQQFIIDYAKAGNCVLLSSTHYSALETFCTHLYRVVHGTIIPP